MAFFLAISLSAIPLFAAAVVPPTGTYTLVALPDTQIYAQDYPDIYTAQTKWILDNKDLHNIQYVMQLGDVTNRNTTVQWDNAKEAWSLLDGEVPYAIAPGNHDYGTSGSANNRWSHFNENTYFGRNSSYAMQPTVDGFFESGRTDNSYHTFTMGEQDWMILALEFGPRDDVVTWANQVVESHPDHQVILITHSYMYNHEVRNDHILAGENSQGSPYKYGVADLEGGVNDGQDLYEKLVADNSNIFMALSGHIGGDGTGYRETIREDGSIVHEMLIDYQFDTKGGNGFLRLFEFLPDGSTVNVKSYSPYVDAYDTESDQDFTIAVFDRPVERDPCQAILNDSPSVFYQLQKQDATGLVSNLGSTGATNDGTYSGSGPTAAEFDGDATDQIAIGTFEEMEAWSISAWVRPDQVDTRQTIVSNDRDGSNDDVLFGLAPDGYNNATTVGHWSISHHDDDSQNSTIVESSVAAVAGQWYHLSASCDGETMRLYVDGKLVGESAKSGNDLDWGSAMNQIGRSFNSADEGRPFDGTIGEVAVYNSVLSTSDIKTQRLAAFNRVTAGNLIAHGEVKPTENIVDDVTFPQQSLPGLSCAGQNRGDFQIVIGDRPCYAREGVMLATVAQNGRDGYYGSAEVQTWSDGVLGLATSAAGERGGGAEININTAVAWFPFYAGWKGGHVMADGSCPAMGYDMDEEEASETIVEKVSTGRYRIDMPVNSQTDGMLFTIGANNSNNVTSTHIVRAGDGWYVDIQSNNGDNLRVDAKFSFVYIPYDSEKLIGGNYDGILDQHEQSAGNFAMSRLDTGQYRLDIEGESPETGMLVLEVLNDLKPANDLLSYEADGDSFFIESRTLSNLVLDDAQFCWAFISFNDLISLGTTAIPQIPGDANQDGRVDGSDVTILAGNWQYGAGEQEPEATWAMGDFNNDGRVDGSDVTILAGNWQYGIPPAVTAVPEASVLTLLTFGVIALGIGLSTQKHFLR